MTKPARGITAPDDDVPRDFIARVLGCDVRTITNCVNEGAPKSARGQFPLLAFVQWYLERERAAARGAKGLNDLDLARQRKTIAEARIAEIELADREGRSIPTELHVSRMRERLESVAGNVKAMNRYRADVKKAITDDEADALLERMSDEILAELFGLKDTIE
ncbi:MAG TPA: hypothetical protein VIP11_12190 [Gemmatimonadaceae bacterium]